jgi:hypothetical protein
LADALAAPVVIAVQIPVALTIGWYSAGDTLPQHLGRTIAEGVLGGAVER